MSIYNNKNNPFESKTNPKLIIRSRPKQGSRRPAWRPEAVGLSRDELRQIVLDALG